MAPLTSTDDAADAAQAAVPKKKKKKRQEPEPEPEEEPEPPPAPAKKRKKKEPEPEPEEEPEPDPEEVPEQTGEVDKEKAAQHLRVLREHKRTSGYRSKAYEAGFAKDGNVVMAQGYDAFASLLSAADARRLLRFYPEVLNKSSYDEAETKQRMALSTESLPMSSAREAQANLEPVFRFLMTDSLDNAVEQGKVRVNAQHMFSAIRKYSAAMKYTAVLPPKGLIKHALDQGVKDMKSVPADMSKEAAAAEKKENMNLGEVQKKMEDAEKARKNAFRLRKEELMAAKAAAA